MIEPPRDFEPELMERLGWIVMRWAYVEHCVSELFVWMTEGDPPSMAVVTSNVSQATLLGWIRTLLDATLDYSDQANEIREILNEIDELRAERNTLVHGLWSCAGPAMSAIVQTVRLERSAIVHELVVTTADLDSLLDHIVELATRLRALLVRNGVKI